MDIKKDINVIVDEDFIEIDEEILNQKLVEAIWKIIQSYQIDLDSELNFFGIENEFEIYTGNFTKFSKEVRKKKLNQEIHQRRILDRLIILK